MHQSSLLKACLWAHATAPGSRQRSIRLTYQLVPPNDHCCNVAKKAIQTWKDHFIAILSGTADKFPLNLWCQLIPHMERQLNLLCQSNTNSKISAYAHLYGPHVWKPSSMTNPTDARPMPNTAPKNGSLASPQSTTGAGKYGLPPHSPLALPQQCFSNTNTSLIHLFHLPMHSSLQGPTLPTSFNTMPKHST